MEQPVVVVGGLNVDVLARVSAAPTTSGSSNPGHVLTAAGGVGRNIAENLARLGSPVRMHGAVGADAAGDRLVAGLTGLGVDVAGVRRDAATTGSYTAVLDHAGELVIGVADMATTDGFGPDELPPDLLEDAAWLVVDGNLPAATIARCLALADASGVPAAYDPVGVAKARRVSSLHGVHTFSPNEAELAAWTCGDGIAAAYADGVAVVWLREGPAGSTVWRPGKAPAKIQLPGATVVDVTGAGDAMLAAYVHRCRLDDDPVTAARYGAAAAWLTVGSAYPVHPDLDDALVRSTLEELT